MADILEGLGGILAGDVEKNLLATAIQRKEFGLARVVVSQVGRPMRGTGNPHPSIPEDDMRPTDMSEKAGMARHGTYGCSSTNLPTS